MKYVKMLGLAAVAAMALMAFLGAGTASATVLCKTTADPCPEAWRYPAGTVIDASVETSARLATTGGTTIFTCTTGTIKGSTSNVGSSTETVKSTIPKGNLSFGSCSTTVDVLAEGLLEVHKIAGTSNGTVTSTGTEVTVNFLGASCIFGTNRTDIGTLTEGINGTLDSAGVLAELTGNFGCPGDGVLSGNYKVTEPSTTLAVSNS